MFNDNQLIAEMDRLRKFALRLTRNTANADDLLQNTVLRAYEKRHLFEKGSNVFSWTSKIMYNLFVSDYRRKVKFENQYDPEPILNKESAVVNQHDQMLVQEVGEAMSQLSEDHRNILVMVCVQGMKYEETAEQLCIPVGTVRSRLSRARSLLHDMIESDHFVQGFGIPNQLNDNSKDKRIAA
jgi:RNA polymerase sigma-70 factor (ECF subfamily)